MCPSSRELTSAALPTDTRPLVLSGPSGVGKGTLYNLLFSRHPDTFALSVSHTTRAPRPGESHGVHYHFVQMADFEDLISQSGFVEHAKFGGNRYGTSKKTIEEQTAKGKVVLLDIEMEVRQPGAHDSSPHRSPLFTYIPYPFVYLREAAVRASDLTRQQGVKQIKASGIDARYIFIAPPSEEALEQRLRGRGTETEESVQKRLRQAKNELEYSKTPGVHDIIIVNDDLETAYKELEDFVYKSK